VLFSHPKPSNAVSCASLPFIDFIMNIKLHRMIQQCHFEAYCWQYEYDNAIVGKVCTTQALILGQKRSRDLPGFFFKNVGNRNSYEISAETDRLRGRYMLKH
jgi:hypothetical protein